MISNITSSISSPWNYRIHMFNFNFSVNTISHLVANLKACFKSRHKSCKTVIDAIEKRNFYESQLIFAICKSLENHEIIFNFKTKFSQILRWCHTSRFSRPIFNPCYRRQLLTQLCYAQRSATVCYTKRFLTQRSKFRQQYCRFLITFVELATCCRNEMLR